MHLCPLALADQLTKPTPPMLRRSNGCAPTDLTELTPGRVDIDGDRLFANVETGQGHDPASRRFESHRKYIDWQYNIAGGERMRHTDARDLPISEDLLSANDLCFHQAPSDFSDLLVPAGWLAVYEPHDAHMPSLRLQPEQSQAYHKVVVKILLA